MPRSGKWTVRLLRLRTSIYIALLGLLLASNQIVLVCIELLSVVRLRARVGGLFLCLDDKDVVVLG